MSKIASQVRKATEAAKGGMYTYDAPSGTQSGANITSVFPRGGFSTASPHDEVLRQKAEFVAKAPTGTAQSPYGIISVTDQDLATIRQKRETEAKANFDAWEGSLYTHDPVRRAWVDSIDPEFAGSRINLMLERAKFALRVKSLLLRGPRNEKDLMLMWGLQTGNIQLDRDWDRIGPAADFVPNMADEQKRFAKGLMNPWQYMSDSERAGNRKGPDGAPNPFDPKTNLKRDGGQSPAPFLGPEVTDKNRYPAFLANIMKD